MSDHYTVAWHELVVLAGGELLAKAAVAEAQRTPAETMAFARRLILEGWTPEKGDGWEYIRRREARMAFGLPPDAEGE